MHMKLQTIVARVSLLLGICLASTAIAGNHAGYVGNGPFKTGPDVTKKCLECHSKEAKDFMKTSHWNWTKDQMVKGKKEALGKKNVINNFCISLTGNWPRCTSCHAGYGWKDGSFDFTKAENVDCLVCHDTTGSYKKFPAGAGHPAYAGENKEWPAKSGKMFPVADLVKVAQSVGKPNRATCGSCHFYGGGGDHIKHGDLDSSLTKPTADIDVHMGRMNFTCQTCHKTKSHAIPGESLLVSQGDAARVQCTDCHKAAPHKNGFYNKHAKKVACQTCHVPTIAKALPTKVWWDWSKAGQDIKPEHDKFGMETYAKIKGEFRWNKDFAPEYFWYNGKVDRTLADDKIDPAKVVQFNRPLGDRNDPKALITPFKVMRGKQPYDKGNNVMATVKVFGPGGYWATFDWNQAIANGMKAAGRPYSGTYGFVETSMVWKVNHMVAPKEKALKCNDCHGDKGRLDWKALGYKGDPKNPANR